MALRLDSDIVVSGFTLQSNDNVYIWTNTLENRMNLRIPLAMGQTEWLLIFN